MYSLNSDASIFPHKESAAAVRCRSSCARVSTAQGQKPLLSHAARRRTAVPRPARVLNYGIVGGARPDRAISVATVRAIVELAVEGCRA